MRLPCFWALCTLAAKLHASAKDEAVTFSPFVNVQPLLISIVYWVASSFGVIDLATSSCWLPSASKLTRPSNR